MVAVCYCQLLTGRLSMSNCEPTSTQYEVGLRTNNQAPARLLLELSVSA